MNFEITAGFITQIVIYIVLGTIAYTKLSSKVDNIKEDIIEIKGKLGNGQEGIFLRKDLYDETHKNVTDKMEDIEVEVKLIKKYILEKP